jgi:hypothetical protein
LELAGCWRVIEVIAFAQAVNALVMVTALCIAVVWLARSEAEEKRRKGPSE